METITEIIQDSILRNNSCQGVFRQVRRIIYSIFQRLVPVKPFLRLVEKYFSTKFFISTTENRFSG